GCLGQNCVNSDENCQVVCATPLHVGEAKPCPAQPPLSRANDQSPSRLTNGWPVAQLTRALAFDSVKTSVLVSFTPIIGVIPIMSPVWLCTACAACCADNSMSPPLSLAEP